MDRASTPQKRVGFCAASILYLLFALFLLTSILIKAGVFVQNSAAVEVKLMTSSVLIFIAAVFLAVTCFIRKRTILHFIALAVFAAAAALSFFFDLDPNPTIVTAGYLFGDNLLIIAATLAAVLTGVSFFTKGRATAFRRIWFIPGILSALTAFLLILQNVLFIGRIGAEGTTEGSALAIAALVEIIAYLILVPGMFISCKWLSVLYVHMSGREAG